MVEALVISVLGSFVYDNLDFFHVVKEQRKDGYRWEMNIKDRNPDVPTIYPYNMKTVQKKLFGF